MLQALACPSLVERYECFGEIFDLHRQNTLHIMLQALACPSLVEKYECFGETFDLHRQNTLYIIVQALACPSLVERYECFGENFDLHRQNTLYIMLQALACLGLVERYECWRGIGAWIIRTPCILCSKHSRVSVGQRSTNVEEETAPKSSEHPVYYAPSTRMSQCGREVRMFWRNLRPASSEHSVYYASSTRVSRSGRAVRMLKRNLRLNHQNTLYFMLQALACLGLVERYECWRGNCAWIIRTPCILCSKHSRVSVWQRSTNVLEKSSTRIGGTPHTLYPEHSRVSDWHAKISCLFTH